MIPHFFLLQPMLAQTKRSDEGMEYYRLRSFSITPNGIFNLGDSFKSRRSRSISSVNSTESSQTDVSVCNRDRLPRYVSCGAVCVERRVPLVPLPDLPQMAKAVNSIIRRTRELQSSQHWEQIEFWNFSRIPIDDGFNTSKQTMWKPGKGNQNSQTSKTV